MHVTRSSLVLAAGDLACLAGFVLVGMRDHGSLERANSAARLAVNSLPIMIAWLAAGAALGAFRLPAGVPLRTVWGRTLAAWLIAAPVGLLIRALLLRAATIVVIFALVTLGLGGGLLLLWRTLFWLAAARRTRPALARAA